MFVAITVWYRGISMNEQSVSKLLKELDKELSKSESLSRRDRQMLERLLFDIQELLARGKTPAPVDTALLDRLREATGRFEATHPNLTGGIAQVIDSLTNLGI